MDSNEFFSETYVEAREKFGAACQASGVDVSSIEHPSVTGPKGESLAIDVVVFGRADAPNMVFINTGTHGIEGFCGSAIVTQWIERREYEGLGDNVGALIVHGLNPWGFAHLRRTTENNVDLNRNFVDHTTPYPDIRAMPNCMGSSARKIGPRRALAEAKEQLDAYSESHGRDTMMDALIRGQYSHADGMNYGGSQREWSNLALERICRERLAHVRHLGFIDWHTGIGEHGELVFLCFNEEGGDLPPPRR